MELPPTTLVSEAPAQALKPQLGSPSAFGGHREDGGGDDSEDGEGEEGDVEEEMA